MTDQYQYEFLYQELNLSLLQVRSRWVATVGSCPRTRWSLLSVSTPSSSPVGNNGKHCPRTLLGVFVTVPRVINKNQHTSTSTKYSHDLYKVPRTVGVRTTPCQTPGSVRDNGFHQYTTHYLMSTGRPVQVDLDSHNPFTYNIYWGFRCWNPRTNFFFSRGSVSLTKDPLNVTLGVTTHVVVVRTHSTHKPRVFDTDSFPWNRDFSPPSTGLLPPDSVFPKGQDQERSVSRRH